MNKKNGARAQKRGRVSGDREREREGVRQGDREALRDASGDPGSHPVGISGAGAAQGAQGAIEGAWSVDAGLPVSRYMKTEVAYLRDNMWVDAAVGFLEARGLRDAPVLDQEGRPVGVLYVDDVESEAAFVEVSSSGDEEALQGTLLREMQVDERIEDRFTSMLLRRHGLGSGFHLDGGPRLRVSDVMVPYVPEIGAEASIATAALVMRDNQLGHVMVVGDDGRAVGVFSREDLVRWLVEETHRRPAREAGTGRCLRDVMRPVIAVRRRATLTTARDLMTTHDLNELPVVEGGRVVGVVTELEIAGMLSAHRDDDGWMQELLVEDVMNAPALVGAPNDPIANVRLEEAHGGCVLVADHGRLIGIVTERDLQPAGGPRAPQLGDQLLY
jgi:CBS domain-containing protein